MSKRRTEIIIETERLTILRGARTATMWCEACGRTSRMLAVDEAAALSGTSSRLIYRLVEAGSLHFIETKEGWLRVCETSLDQHGDWLRQLAHKTRGPLATSLSAFAFLSFFFSVMRELLPWLAERFFL